MADPILTLTDEAANRVKALMDNAEMGIGGLRVGLATRGCAGLAYEVEYAGEQRQFEEIIEHKGVRIFIDPAAVMFLIGSEMDYQESKFQSGFTFTNPNEKGRCGCGESFMV